jgi:hypothetical protein
MNKEEIGTNAGMVWQALYANGAMSFDDLIETTGLNTESAYSALGWLAREDKLDFQEQNGVVSLYVYQEKYY